MAKRNEIFPSKYLKASDLNGKPLKCSQDARKPRRSAAATMQAKTILRCNGVKPLPLNMTNWDSVAAIAGDDTDDWPGHRRFYQSHGGTEDRIVDHPHPAYAKGL